MEEWNKAFRVWVERIRIAPDMSLRTYVISLSCLGVILSGYTGYIVARIQSADEHVRLVGFDSFTPWTSAEMAYARGNIAALGEAGAKEFVASYGGKVYYHKTCKGVSRIKEENRVWFSAAAVAEMSGYTRAKNCSW